MRKKVTKKLFKKKYNYKIDIRHNLGYISNLNTLEQRKSPFEEDATEPQYISYLNVNYHKDWKHAIDNLITFREIIIPYLNTIKLTYNYNWFTMYTNNGNMVDAIIKQVPTIVDQVSSPPPHLLLKPDEIYMPKIEHEYRITLKNAKVNDDNFFEWMSGNEAVRIPPSTEYLLKHQSSGYRYQSGKYFYVDSEDTLLLIKMIFNDQIRLIEKIVH